MSRPLTGPRLQWLAWPRYFVGWTSLLEDCQRRYGDVFRLRLPFFGSVVVIADPEAVRTVFGDRDTQAARARQVRSVQDILGDGTLILLDGERHRQRRRLLSPPFHGKHLAGYEPTIAAAVTAHTARWRSGEIVDIAQFAPGLTMDVIARVLFGVSDPAITAQFGAHFQRLMSAWALTTVLPGWAKTERGGPWARFAAVKHAFHALIEAQIDRHRGESIEGGDVCSLLLAATDEDGRSLSDEEVRDELVMLSLAGTHTTAISLAWAFDLVLHDPATLARLEANPDDIPFCDAIVQEALRLRPPLDSPARRLGCDMELCGVRVRAGEVVYPAIHLIHRRDEIYQRPEEFRPERFLDERLPAYAWLPFGGGARRCIGGAIAQLELRIAIQEVVKRWHVRPRRSRQARPRRSRAFFWAPAGGVPTDVTPRSNGRP